MVGHVNSSLEGLATIRASNAVKKLQDEFDRHQDLYSSAIVTLRLAYLGFNFYMDFMSALFSIVVIARFIFFDHGKLTRSAILYSILSKIYNFFIIFWSDTNLEFEKCI